MIYQRICPVCRSEVLQQVLRDATFLADLGGELNPLTGVASYRCTNGHVFMILQASTVDKAKATGGTLRVVSAHAG